MHIDFSTLHTWTNKVYYPFYFDYNRYNIFFGSASSGKSFFVGCRLVYRFIREKGRNFIIIRKTSKSNKFSTYPLIKQILNMWGLLHTSLIKENKTEGWIENKINGNRILLLGLDDPEKIKSITFPTGPATDIWIEEATELSEYDFKQTNLRLRGITTHKKQLTMTFNPISATHWIKNKFFDNDIYKNSLTVLKTTYLDNSRLTEDDIQQFNDLKEDDYEYYKIYGLGDWGIIGNTVFHNYTIENFSYTYDDFDMVCAGMDFGYNHPFAIELMGFKDDEIYIFNELYTRKRTNNEVIILNESENVLPKDQLCNADSAEPDRIDEWRLAGYNVFGAKKGKDSVRYGVDFLRRHRVHIHKHNCPGIAAEFPIFKYREDKDGNVFNDEYVNFKDDGIAACRYATEDLWNRINHETERKPFEIGMKSFEIGDFK